MAQTHKGNALGEVFNSASLACFLSQMFPLSCREVAPPCAFLPRDILEKSWGRELFLCSRAVCPVSQDDVKVHCEPQQQPLALMRIELSMTLLSLIVKVELELCFRSGVDTALEEHSCALKCCFTCRIYRGTHRIDYFFPISLTTTYSLQIGSNFCHFQAIVSRSQRCAKVEQRLKPLQMGPQLLGSQRISNQAQEASVSTGTARGQM